MRATNKEVEALDECYRKLYENSEPRGDWDVLKHRHDDFFMEYEIDMDLCEKIISDTIKKYKIKKNRPFSATILLGCSPKCKKKTE